jgi:hypothetical protein
MGSLPGPRDGEHRRAGAQHVAAVSARERASVAFVYRLDVEAAPSQQEHIVRPTRRRLLDGRASALAGLDERMKRPSFAPGRDQSLAGILAASGNPDDVTQHGRPPWESRHSPQASAPAAGASGNGAPGR